MSKINLELRKLLNLELKRQQNCVNLIASENFVSEEILVLSGSILTNKYSEGYPNRRYYGGCVYIDKIEQLAINTLKKIFNAEHANVQPHSGSQANAAVYFALLNPGDVVLAMDLSSGGHLTHGYKVNFSGKIYNFYNYAVDSKTEMLNYDEIKKQAKQIKPKLIIAGASSYSRKIDFKCFREIADSVGAYFMVDMAHIAGLVAANLHQNPVEYADVVTSTTHKTLRGARGGFILCKKKLAKLVDNAVFPGNQGGPFQHIIAAKAQGFLKVLEPEFKTYQQQVVVNAKIFSDCFIRKGCKIVSNGTDNHLFLINVKSSFNITGQEAEKLLQKVGIVCNKNVIPFDTENPTITSGIRLGTAAMTTRGFKEKEFIILADIIINVLNDFSNKNIVNNRKKVFKLLKEFPIYNKIKY